MEEEGSGGDGGSCAGEEEEEEEERGGEVVDVGGVGGVVFEGLGEEAASSALLAVLGLLAVVPMVLFGGDWCLCG